MHFIQTYPCFKLLGRGKFKLWSLSWKNVRQGIQADLVKIDEYIEKI